MTEQNTNFTLLDIRECLLAIGLHHYAGIILGIIGAGKHKAQCQHNT